MNYSINDLLEKNLEIYGIPNDRLYSNEDLLHYQQKFILRYLRNINNGDKQKAIEKLVVVSCWFSAIISRFHIDLESKTAQRYPYKCPFCLSLPCLCKDGQEKKTKKTGRPVSKTPETITDWQEMIGRIYSADNLEKINNLVLIKSDELACSFRKFLRDKGKNDFRDLENATADFFVLLLRIFNVLEINLEDQHRKMFNQGCYVCSKSPCQCNFLE